MTQDITNMPVAVGDNDANVVALSPAIVEAIQQANLSVNKLVPLHGLIRTQTNPVLYYLLECEGLVRGILNIDSDEKRANRFAELSGGVKKLRANQTADNDNVSQAAAA